MDVLASLALALVLTGGSRMDVLTLADVDPAMNQPVAIHGTVRRVPMSKGSGAWEGTGVVLDDGTVVYVTYREPPSGWEPLIGKYVRVAGVLRRSLSAKEQSLIAPHLTEFEPPAPAKRDLRRLEGKQVSLEGVARDAKAGAVLLIDRGAGPPVYVLGLSFWPAAMAGKTVRASGTLQHVEHLRPSTVDDAGLHSAGGAGKQWVLREPRWIAIPD